jgi:hypothetical protein
LLAGFLFKKTAASPYFCHRLGHILKLSPFDTVVSAFRAERDLPHAKQVLSSGNKGLWIERPVEAGGVSMRDKAVLLVCEESSRFRPLRSEFAKLGPRVAWQVATEDDAAERLEFEEFSLVVAYLDEACRLEQVDALLWAASRAQQPVALLTLSDAYDPAEALTLFRMGVADYLSLEHHRESLASVITELIGLTVEWEAVSTASMRTRPAARIEAGGVDFAPNPTSI